MKKTQQQIDEMIVKIQAQLDILPARNAFNDSNAEEIVLLKAYIQDLKGGEPYKHTEVHNWVTGEHWSELCDFE